MTGVSAEALRVCARLTRADERGPKVATQTLWSRLHAEVYARGGCLREAFDALAAECGTSDPTNYLGSILRKMTAGERADKLMAAAARIDDGEVRRAA